MADFHAARSNIISPLQWTSLSPPLTGRGGIPIQISHAINYFGDKARHTIISTNDDYGAKEVLNSNVNVNFPDLDHLSEGSLYNRLKNYQNYLKNVKPDALLSYNWGSIEWVLANSFSPKIYNVHSEHGFGPDEAEKTLFRRDVCRRFSLRNTETILVPSLNLKNIALNIWHQHEEKIQYIPNGVDITKFEDNVPSGPIAGFKKHADEIIIGTIAPLRPEKNIGRMIKAFAQLRASNINACLLIIGDGAERGKLETLCETLKIQDYVIFAGYISKPETVIGYLDIFAISSDTEQMPNTILEAMAASLPVVGVAVGDVKNMVSAQNQEYITPLNDEDAFIMAMEKITSTKETQLAIGYQNLLHVKQKYDRLIMYKKYAALWEID